jgi:hypothetical protein
LLALSPGTGRFFPGRLRLRAIAEALYNAEFQRRNERSRGNISAQITVHERRITRLKKKKKERKPIHTFPEYP